MTPIFTVCTRYAPAHQKCGEGRVYGSRLPNIRMKNIGSFATRLITRNATSWAIQRKRGTRG